MKTKIEFISSIISNTCVKKLKTKKLLGIIILINIVKIKNCLCFLTIIGILLIGESKYFINNHGTSTCAYKPACAQLSPNTN